MQQEPSKWAGGGINVSGEAPFEIRGFSLANAAALVGLAITVASFFEYFSTGGAGGLSGIGFVYGIPIALIGLALKVRCYRVRSIITVLLTDSSMIHIWYTSLYGNSDTAVREVRLLLHCCTYVYSYIIRKCSRTSLSYDYYSSSFNSSRLPFSSITSSSTRYQA